MKLFEKSLLFAVLALLPLGLFSCEKIEGEGPVVEQELDVNYFNELKLSDSFDVYVTYGDEQKVVAVGQQNIIDRLQTDVSDDDLLDLDLKNGRYSDYTLKVYIELPILSSIDIAGSGNIYADSIVADALFVGIDGSGNVHASNISAENESGALSYVKTLIQGSGNISIKNMADVERMESVIKGSGDISYDDSGETSYHKAYIQGSGNVYAFDVLSKEGVANIQGSGNVEISVSESLFANIEGSGSVYYKGDGVEVDSNIEGSGNVVHK